MSRVAKKPISLPKGVEVSLSGRRVTVKGAKGSRDLELHPDVEVQSEAGTISVGVKAGKDQAWKMAGTTRALLNSMVKGVSSGFERKLTLVGVGYRAQASGTSLNLSLGFSHPVVFQAPEGVNIETPSQTEIVVKGADAQKVGQAAAEIRRFRPPEPYKGKGVRYADEVVVRKEAKKK